MRRPRLSTGTVFAIVLSLFGLIVAPPPVVAMPSGSSLARPALTVPYLMRDSESKSKLILGGGAFDLAGDLYLANGGNGAIEYEPNLKTIKRVLTNPKIPYPHTVNVAYGVYSGIVAVIDQNGDCSGPGGQCTGSVSFYVPHSVTPCATILAGFQQVLSGAFGAGGDLYVVGFGLLLTPVVGVIHGGCSATGFTDLATGNVIYATGGIAVTPQNQIVIEDAVAGNLYTYENPFKSRSATSLGNPIATTPLMGIAENGEAPYYSFAFTTTGDEVWVVDPTGGTHNKYRYPSGGNPVAVRQGTSFGLAVYPPEFPHFGYP